MISNLSQIILPQITPVREAVPNPSPEMVVKPVSSVNKGGTVNSDHGGAGQSGLLSSGGDGATGQTLADVVEKLNTKIQNLNRNLEFSINHDSGDVMVKVVDVKTREVIRQIPSEEALVLAQNIDRYMQEHHVGLVKTKA